MSTGNTPEAKKFLKNVPEWLFTDNESNLQKLYNSPNSSPYVKDAFHRVSWLSILLFYVPIMTRNLVHYQ